MPKERKVLSRRELLKLASLATVGAAASLVPGGRGRAQEPPVLDETVHLPTTVSSAVLRPRSPEELSPKKLRERFGAGITGGLFLDEFPPPEVSQIHVVQTWGRGSLFREGADTEPYKKVRYLRLVGAYSPGTVSPPLSEIPDLVRDLPPGSIFCIGNELGVDDNRLPEQAAKDYHKYYEAIKKTRPEIFVGPGGIVPTFRVHSGEVLLTTDVNKELEKMGVDLSKGLTRSGISSLKADLANELERMLLGEIGKIDGVEYYRQMNQAHRDLYGSDLRFDFATVHPYVLAFPGIHIGIVKQGINEYRQALTENGFRGPLFANEIGVLYDNAVREEVAKFMIEVYQAILDEKDEKTGCLLDNNRLIQSCLWFVLNNGIGRFAGLWTKTNQYISETKEETLVGACHRTFVGQL